MAFKSYQAGDIPTLAAGINTHADTHKLVFVTMEDMALLPGVLTSAMTTTCLNSTLTLMYPKCNQKPSYNSES